MNTIEVNGVLYEPVPKKTSDHSSKMVKMLMASAMMSSYLMGGRDHKKPTPDVNIIDEFGLIQNKKSKLSRSEREWVVYQFHKNYREVKS